MAWEKKLHGKKDHRKKKKAWENKVGVVSEIGNHSQTIVSYQPGKHFRWLLEQGRGQENHKEKPTLDNLREGSNAAFDPGENGRRNGIWRVMT